MVIGLSLLHTDFTLCVHQTPNKLLKVGTANCVGYVHLDHPNCVGYVHLDHTNCVGYVHLDHPNCVGYVHLDRPNVRCIC